MHGLLQFIAVQHVRQPYLESTVSPECCHTSHHWSSTMRPYYAHATSVALASYLMTSQIQGRMP